MNLKYSKHVFEINENFTCEVYYTYYDDRVTVEYFEKGSNPTPVLMHCLKHDKTLTMKDYARKYLKEFLQTVSPIDLCLVKESAL